MESTQISGRPRDPRIDAAVLQATLELLAEIGYPKLTIPVIAARAGTSAPAVHRRWPSKVELVYEAVLPSTEGVVIPWGNDVESGIRAIVEGSVRMFHDPAVRAAVSGLTAELAAKPGLSGSLLGRLRGPGYEQLQHHLDEAAAAGRIRPGIDARYLLDMIGGSVFMSVTNERELDESWIDHTVAIIVRGLA